MMNKITLSDGIEDRIFEVDDRTYQSMLSHSLKYGEEVVEE